MEFLRTRNIDYDIGNNIDNDIDHNTRILRTRMRLRMSENENDFGVFVRMNSFVKTVEYIIDFKSCHSNEKTDGFYKVKGKITVILERI
jgi:hypothetical protein